MIERRAGVGSRVIHQAVTKESLFAVLAEWCKAGAGRKDCTLQILSAFASGNGVSAIAPLLDVFLADGNTVEIIVGIDFGGTDRAALRHLYSLSEAYQKQCLVRVFNAPSRMAIFHPKLYLFRARDRLSYVIGSANLTSGGLGMNFESLIYFPECRARSAEGDHGVSIWEIFAAPKTPLKPEYLRELTQEYLSSLVKRLPEQAPYETQTVLAAARHLWRPLSRVPLPRSTKPAQRQGTAPKLVPTSFLLMDILQETRGTQVQIPLDLVEQFFKVERHERAVLPIRIWTETGFSLPIDRTLVLSQGADRGHVMRRLEMPQIRGLSRPLAVLFVVLPGKQGFAFTLIPRNSNRYKVADTLLRRDGQQGRGERRFIMASGSAAKGRSTIIRKLLPQ
jgi:HKD family nuclease